MGLFILDAQALACPQLTPNSKAPRIEIIAYIERLLQWTQLSRIKSIKFISNEDLVPALVDEDCYPFWNSLEEALTISQCDLEFQLQDINALLQALIEKSDKLEDITQIKEVVLGTSQITDDVIDFRSMRFSAHICRTITIKGLSETNFPELSSRMRLVSSLSKGNKTLKINSSINLLELEDGTLEENIGSQDFAITCHAEFKDFARQFDPFSWWQLGEKDGCREAIIVNCAAEESNVQAALSISDTFHFGPDFLHSASKLGFIHEKTKALRLIRACRATILKENLEKTHHLREKSGGNSKQKEQGKCKAWRRDIDDEFHLHYWLLESGIEFANVVVHQDFEISSSLCGSHTL